MSLPHGFLDELRSRTSLAQVVGRKVMWDARKSNQGKGDMWAPCPFHQEKTASFHVDDRQGFYYCFGCHAKGDAISFVRETENVSFMEAIEILAREAGMPMPERDPAAQQRADRRTELADVMEAAVQFFRLQLKTSAGTEARGYLARRGLDEAAQDRWGIGFAPPGWEGLREALAAKGITPEQMLAAGLVKASDKGRAPYDTFRNRIMFPIRDGRDRAIAFGGRAMDPSDNAKYLNSPETELFDKGRTLYNIGPARKASGKDQTLIVAEGYMDVIALSEAGFGAAVAPLGTAITEDQLRLMWRLHPEPVITLDGDAAGQRAAMRLIDLALPMLEAGQSLRFCIMPEGLDPDDLLKSKGSEAMDTLIKGAQPLVKLLWQRETEGKVFDSPERRAALDKSLRIAISKIQDQSIKAYYGEAIKELRWELFRGNRGGDRGGNRGGPGTGGTAGKRDWQGGNWQGGRGRFGAPPRPVQETKSSYLAAASDAQFEERIHEAVLLAALVHCPAVLPDFETALERLDFDMAEHREIARVLLSHAHPPAEDMVGVINAALGPHPLEKLLSLNHVRLCPALRAPEDVETAAMCISEAFEKLDALRALRREVAEAVEDIESLADEGLTWRLAQAAEARSRALRSETDDRGEFDISDNGVRLSRSERNAFSDLLSSLSNPKTPDAGQ